MKFLQLKENGAKFNLAKLQEMCGEGLPSITADLVRIQAKAMQECFFEKLRGNASVAFARERLDSSLATIHFDNEMKWFLGLAMLFHLATRLDCFIALAAWY